MDLEELTSSSADSPASLGHKLGSSEAQKMTVISGRKWLALLQSCDLNISLARMCGALLASPWASSAAFLTWRASGIKPSHLLFQLAPSTPRIEETGSGLLHTPTAKAKQMAPSMKSGWWPTPDATPRGPAKRWTGTRPSGAKESLTLQTAVKMWPTPRSCSAMAAENIQNRVNDKFPNLESVVARTGKMEGHSSGSLNPEWVEWLMGFPAGWTNLTVEELRPELKTASLDLKPSEMPLCRKSSSRSDGRSSRRKKANE